VIAVGYFVLRSIHIATFWALAAGDTGLRIQLSRFGASMGVATGLLVAAAAASGNTRTWLWAGVLVADYGGTFIGGTSGWRLPAARHFAERHGLIVIVALGESIVSIGVGVSDRPFSGAIVSASLLGLALCGAMWWLYFDTSALLTERALADADPSHRQTYEDNASTYTAELRALDAELAAGLAHCERTELVTTHAAFSYLADRYHLTQIAIAASSPEAEPSAARLAELSDTIHAHHVTTVFSESLVSPKVAQALAREAGVTTGVLDPIEGLTRDEVRAGDDYATVMRRNLAALRTALACS
jgi:hypothetical protein